MTRRWLDQAFFTDEKLAQARVEERLLFAAVIANQDDDGRLLGHPGYLRSIAFPYDDFSIEQVKQMRNHLAEINPNFMVYSVENSEYIQLKRHARYQRPRYYHESKYPAPEGWPYSEEPSSGRPGIYDSPEIDHKDDETKPGNREDVERKHSVDSGVAVRKTDGNHAVTIQQPGSNRRETSRYTEGLDLDLDLVLDKDLDPVKTTGIPPVSGAQSTGVKTKNKLKPYQQQSGIFLDMVEREEGVKLLTRPKLIHLVRQLFTISGTTPEKLMEFYRLLKQEDSFFRNRSPPQIIAGMPDRYPSWAAGKPVFEKKTAAKSETSTAAGKSDPLKAMRDAGWDTGGGADDDLGK